MKLFSHRVVILSIKNFIFSPDGISRFRSCKELKKSLRYQALKQVKKYVKAIVKTSLSEEHRMKCAIIYKNFYFSAPFFHHQISCYRWGAKKKSKQILGRSWRKFPSPSRIGCDGVVFGGKNKGDSEFQTVLRWQISHWCFEGRFQSMFRGRKQNPSERHLFDKMASLFDWF